MKIAVAAEADPSEPRVAATPETVKKMIGLGAEVAVQPPVGAFSEEVAVERPEQRRRRHAGWPSATRAPSGRGTHVGRLSSS